jgi:hypothetical protein
MVRDHTPWCNPSELKKGNFMQWVLHEKKPEYSTRKSGDEWPEDLEVGT